MGLLKLANAPVQFGKKRGSYRSRRCRRERKLDRKNERNGNGTQVRPLQNAWPSRNGQPLIPCSIRNSLSFSTIVDTIAVQPLSARVPYPPNRPLQLRRLSRADPKNGARHWLILIWTSRCPNNEALAGWLAGWLVVAGRWLWLLVVINVSVSAAVKIWYYDACGRHLDRTCWEKVAWIVLSQMYFYPWIFDVGRCSCNLELYSTGTVVPAEYCTVPGTNFQCF